MSRSHPVRRAFLAGTALFLAQTLLLTQTAAALPAQAGPAWVRAGMPVEYGHAMAYDSARDRVVLFGGRDAGGAVVGQTWEWDGSSWTERRPVTTPPARAYHAMAYDAAQKRVVMFGGIGDPNTFVALPDMWEWDGVDWTQRTPATMPSARYYHAMVYDPVFQRTLLVDGRTASLFFNDAWLWDGNTWTQTAITPFTLTGHALGYDSARGRVVLFGGLDPSDVVHGDTWEWDGTAWTLRSSGGPSARHSVGMAYDANRNVTVMHGGTNNWIWGAPRTNPGNGFADTWEWDGTSWTQPSPTTAPVARWSGSMVYDALRQRMVMFGGQPDTWEWDGTDWSNRTTSPAIPDSRDRYAMAHDSVRQRTVLFGGGVPSSGAARDETWEWDGASWTQRLPAHSPSPRAQVSMAYDAARQRVVLFGGLATSTVLGDTWEWDGNDWTQRFPTHAPSPRHSNAIAYDAARQRIVLFGGGGSTAAGFSDTWEWDGTDWTQRSPASAPSARGTTMAYDAARQRVVLFGGSSIGGLLNDTWEWDGNTWTQSFPTSSPSARFFHAMAHDARSQRVVLFGGVDFSQPNPVYDDTWEWDGVDWTLNTAATGTVHRYGIGLTPDVHGNLVMFGGNPWYRDTWLYAEPAASQPFGVGCSLGSAPQLASTAPKLGSVFGLDLVGAQPSTIGFFGVSFAPAAVSIPPCTLYLGGAIIALPAITNAAGFAASTRFTIPPDPILSGADMFAQAFVFDPQGPYLGLSFSAGLHLVLGM